MTDAATTLDTRIVNRDCVAWNTKNNGKPEGGADSRPINVPAQVVVEVQGVSVETEPRSLLVVVKDGGGLTGKRLEIREQFLDRR